MGFLNNIMDSFNSAEFTVTGNKKLKSISRDFKRDFGLSLVFYKGNMKVKAVEKIFKDTFGTKVQIKDKSAKKLIDNNISLGDAARENS